MSRAGRGDQAHPVSGAIDIGPARIEPYVFNPVPGALFLWLDLRAERGGG